MTTQNEKERTKNIDYVLHAIEVIRPTPLCECNALLVTETNATLMEATMQPATMSVNLQLRLFKTQRICIHDIF